MRVMALAGFDGASPHDRANMKRREDGAWVLYPNRRMSAGISEEGGSGFRLSARFANESAGPQETTVIVDWENAKYISGLDLGYVCHDTDAEWRMVPGTLSRGVDGALDGKVEYRLVFASGVTRFGLYPEYNYEMCQAFVRRVGERGAIVREAGKSREGRAIWALELPSANSNARPFMIQARDHAYETAGSYCVEGMVDYLLGGSEMAAYLRNMFSFHVLPMTNVDGVYNGMSRLTHETGTDLNRVIAAADPAHEAVKATIDAVKPYVYVNIHNWSFKFEDGLLSNEENIMERIAANMPDDFAAFKRWSKQSSYDVLKKLKLAANPRENWSWKNYVKNEYNGIGVAFEFPWFGRNTADMRKVGVKTLLATAAATIEEEYYNTHFGMENKRS